MAITAQELMEKLNADPEWVARRKRQDEEHARRMEELRQAGLPLMEDLRAIGYEVDCINTFLSLPKPKPDVLPILLDHVQRPYPSNLRVGIAMALVAQAKDVSWDTILDLYRREKDPWVQQMLANVVEVHGRRRLDEVLQLLRDESLGDSRVLLLSAVDKSKDPGTDAILEEMASDPQLTVEATYLIKKRAKNRERREERRRAKESQ